jgi:Uma2 family endonuclease
MATQTLLSLEQFLDLPDKPGVAYFELDEGEVIEVAQPVFEHGAIQAAVARLFGNHVKQTAADFFISIVPGFILASNIERAPDVCLVRKASLRAMRMFKGAYYGAPDLAVEIVSKNEGAVDLDRKVKQYLNAGTTSVWVVYSETRHVMVHRQSGEIRDCTAGQTMEEAELLPGLRIAVDEIFSVV